MRPSWRRGRDLERLADDELMSLIADADPDAFAVIYDRHCDIAFSLAYRMCGKRASAEEVVQEAFLSLWRGASGYVRTRGSVRSWVLRIVHNRAIDALRRGAVRDSHLLYDEAIAEREPAGDLTDEQALHRHLAHSIHEALQELPREQSRAIELAYFGGFSHTEIASMLQLPAGTVKGRLRLGLSKLRVTLADEHDEGVEHR